MSGILKKSGIGQGFKIKNDTRVGGGSGIQVHYIEGVRVCHCSASPALIWRVIILMVLVFLGGGHGDGQVSWTWWLWQNHKVMDYSQTWLLLWDECVLL
jgi:hypothetical protein